jgi:hypothetical protein
MLAKGITSSVLVSIKMNFLEFCAETVKPKVINKIKRFFFIEN